jgi:hypothetical protein
MKMEAAILPILNEDSTVEKVADKLGVDREDVTAWLSAHLRAEPLPPLDPRERSRS